MGYEGQAFEVSPTDAKNWPAIRSFSEEWGFEDLEVALGGVVAFGAVDDGFGGGVPSEFLEGGVFANLRRSSILRSLSYEGQAEL